jgi:hypothetical protein
MAGQRYAAATRPDGSPRNRYQDTAARARVHTVVRLGDALQRQRSADRGAPRRSASKPIYTDPAAASHPSSARRARRNSSGCPSHERQPVMRSVSGRRCLSLTHAVEADLRPRRIQALGDDALQAVLAGDREQVADRAWMMRGCSRDGAVEAQVAQQPPATGVGEGADSAAVEAGGPGAGAQSRERSSGVMEARP